MDMKQTDHDSIHKLMADYKQAQEFMAEARGKILDFVMNDPRAAWEMGLLKINYNVNRRIYK